MAAQVLDGANNLEGNSIQVSESERNSPKLHQSEGGCASLWGRLLFLGKHKTSKKQNSKHKTSSTKDEGEEEEKPDDIVKMI